MAHLFIVGGNGVLGSAAAKSLLKKGFYVSVFVRDRDKASELSNAGAKIIPGDITNPEDVKGVFQGSDVVITAAHGLLGRGSNRSENVDDSGHRRLIDEAKACGVKQFIYTSVASAAENHPIDFYRTKYKIERLLEKSGMRFTILRLPAFMEWHAYNLLGKSIIDKGKVTIMGNGTNPLNFIAVNDIVEVLNLIVLNEKFFNQTVILGGPENLSRNQVAEMFGKVLGVKPKVSHVPPVVLSLFSALLQPVHPGLARIMKLTLYSEKSDETLSKEYSIQRYGLKPTTMEEFIHSIAGK